MRAIWRRYAGRTILGTHYDGLEINALKPAVLPGMPGRAKYKPANRTNGPIGYLFNSAAHLGGAINSDFVLRFHNEEDIHICKVPTQHMHSTILAHAERARFAIAAQTRTDPKGCKEIDKRIVHKIQSGFDIVDQLIYNHAATLSGLSLQTFEEYGQAQSTVCQFCQAPVQDLLHLL